MQKTSPDQFIEFVSGAEFGNADAPSVNRFAEAVRLSPDASFDSSHVPHTFPISWISGERISNAVPRGPGYLVHAQQFISYKSKLDVGARYSLGAKVRFDHEKKAAQLQASAADDAGDVAVEWKADLLLVPEIVATERALPPEPGPLLLSVAAITQDQVRRYATASGDNNAIHLDSAVARQAGLADCCVPGMLLIGQFEWALRHSMPQRRLVATSSRFLRPLIVNKAVSIFGRTIRTDPQSSASVVRLTVGDDDRHLICYCDAQVV